MPHGRKKTIARLPLAEERAAALDEFFEELSVASVRSGAGWQEINQLRPLFPELAGKS